MKQNPKSLLEKAGYLMIGVIALNVILLFLEFNYGANYYGNTLIYYVISDISSIAFYVSLLLVIIYFIKKG